MAHESDLERRRHELVASPLFNLTFMPSLLLLPDSLRIYRATDAATRVLGYSHDELQERTLYDLLVEPRERIDAALERARTQPPFVLTARRPDREERIIEGIVHRLDEYQLLHFSFADLTDLHLPRRALRETSAISPQHTGYAYLRELVCALSRTFDGAHTYIGRLVEPQRVAGVAYALNGELHEPFDYPLPGTPCENVVAAGFCAYPSGVQELFPNDAALRAMGVESYLGAPLRDSLGRVIGIAWIAHTKPIQASDAVQGDFSVIHYPRRTRTAARADRSRSGTIARPTPASAENGEHRAYGRRVGARFQQPADRRAGLYRTRAGRAAC
jgi:hypothetical protein